MSEALTLVSHHLCPYVQRAAIALTEKGVPFERRWVDLSNKPDWFRAISPLGKVPLLIVDPGRVVRDISDSDDAQSRSSGADRPGRQAVLFESTAIVEYLEDTQPNPLHPQSPLQRAHHRAWLEFASQMLNAIARLYNAPDEATLAAGADRIGAMSDRLEDELAARESSCGGPYFSGERFSLVDAAFGPVFRYFDTFETAADVRLLEGREHLARWRVALAERPSVAGAIDECYPKRLTALLRHRGTAISKRIRIAA
ncbi:MAG: glutathione S-transferase family protein [Devosia sp.]